MLNLSRNVCDLLEARASEQQVGLEMADAVAALQDGEDLRKYRFADVETSSSTRCANAFNLDDAEDVVRLCLGDEQ